MSDQETQALDALSQLHDIAKNPDSPEPLAGEGESPPLQGEYLAKGTEAPAKEGDRVEFYYQEVMKHYKTGVEGIIQTGVTLAKAKNELQRSYRQLEQILPFSSSVVAYFIQISKSKVLTNPENYKILPSKYNTLYALAQLPDNILEEKIQTKQINPTIGGKLVKSWNTQKRQNKPRTSFRFEGKGGEKLFEVGLIGIADLERVDEFQRELDALLEKYNGKTKFSQTENSVAQKYKGQLLTMATDKINETASGLGKKYTIEEVRALDLAVKYLETPSKKKAPITINGKVEKIGLPSEDKYYPLLSKLLDSKDVTIDKIREYATANKMPCRAVTIEAIDKEVYVWELLRQIAEGKSTEKELDFLTTMATGNSHWKVKQAAEEARNAALKYHNI